MKDWKFHCGVLGVRENASPKEIRRAYRKLALLRHPDKHHGSNRAKEDFQQLNESYRYLLSASPGTARAQGASPQQQKSATSPGPQQGAPKTQQSKPRTSFNAPVVRRSSLPSLQKIRPKSFGQVWVHAGIACAIVFVISIWAEMPDSRPTRSGRDTRDLSLTAYCSIMRSESTTFVQEISEILTERACNSKCQATASQKNVICAWDRKEFFASKGERGPERKTSSAPNPAETVAPKSEDGPARCEVSILKRGQKPGKFKALTQGICQDICIEMMRANPRSEVVCGWDNAEFRHQLLPSPVAGAPKAAQLAREQALRSENPPGPGQSTCYMTLLKPEDTRIFELENETEESCIKKCQKEVLAQPLGQEVRCFFLGKSVVTYIPDPAASYLARSPATTPEASLLGLCEVTVWIGDSRAGGKSSASEEPECRTSCEVHSHRLQLGQSLTCKFKEREFYRQ